jgi:1,6-anhydro-N-acetylmuramate kinase
VGQLCRASGIDRPDLVAAHGQTIWHAPGEGLSWQLFDPWPLVTRLRSPVVHDLRQADLCAGGQGAPITPLADWVLYRDPMVSRLVINLGGIANFAFLPARATPGEVEGGDLGPCNLLIDGVVRALFPGMDCDRDGRLAARGRPSGFVREALRRRSPPAPGGSGGKPRSLGREDYPEDWIAEVAAREALAPEDVIASAVEAVAAEIADAAGPLGAREVILAGGGARNPVLASRLRAGLGQAERVIVSDELGIAAEIREALGIAVLAALAGDGVPITLAQVTGASDAARAGVWVYP